jgi:signal transduction histidine kinase
MGRRRAEVFSQFAIAQDIESDDSKGAGDFTSDVLISLHQTLVIMLDLKGNHISSWGPSNLNEQYGIKGLGGDFKITNVLSSEDISRWEIQVNTVFETGESIRGEYPLYLPLGEFWFDMAFSPVWGPKGEVSAVLVIFRDITMLKEKVNEVVHMYHDLQLYTSLLRHDLSNDIQVILTETEVSEIKESNETDFMKMRDTIKASAERMARVLRAFDTYEDIHGHEIIQLLRRATQQGENVHKTLKIILKSTPDVQNAKVSGGRLLPMVFDNLIRNAAQHAGENPVLRIMVSLKGRKTQIDIRDNGPGIPQDLRKAVFVRRNGRNGLSLCRRILEGCGGSIVILNTKSPGTTFRITLPLIR